MTDPPHEDNPLARETYRSDGVAHLLNIEQAHTKRLDIGHIPN
jgi:hypothetical protein